MKNKKYLLLAATAALFAACSSDDANIATQEKAPAQQQEVGFSAYVNRSTTRAGGTGALTADNIQWDAYNFGVFAYYTDNILYGPSAIPNFMYNQRVKYQGSNYVYEPVKYWPNEFGNGAISDGEDRLTFFAYAPWVDVTPSTGRIRTGSETSGIVGLTSNITTGDPYVKYFVDMDPENRVDLCWGVCKDALGASQTVTGATDNAITAGNQFINVIKPKKDDKISWNFLHALASLNVQIDADVDLAPNGETNSVDAKTKVYVRSVTFKGFALKGLLNLNADNTEPLWYELNSTNTKISSSTVTIHDGRRDGKEGQANATATNETPATLNPAIIQNSSTTNGVTNTKVNLFASDTPAAPVYVIPTGEELEVTIVYDVETEDENVAGFLSDGTTHGSTVENKITQIVKWGSGTPAPAPLVAGKQYNLVLHLGLTSVKFTADVNPWETTPIEGNTDLPRND